MLLERHKPLLRYDSQGSFFADSARMLPERVGRGPRNSNCLRRGDGTVIARARRSTATEALTIDFLGPTKYGNDTRVHRDDFLDAVGTDYVLQARQLHSDPDIADRVYGHVAVDGDGRRWLQYWLFYYFNNKAFLGFGLHEGDWEMVQVGLGPDDQPQAMTFAQHAHAERCAWSAVERHGGQRPVVYVARGSQASYPRAGRHRAPIVPDHADGRGAEISPTLEILGERSPRWVGWPGRWGSSRSRNVAESDSPRGPRQREQWRRPDEFHADALDRKDRRGTVMGQPELRAAAAPHIRATRVGDHAEVEYTLRPPGRGEAAVTQLVVSVDSAGDGLPPATYAFPVEGARGTLHHPLALEDRPYVVRASGFTSEAVGSETVEVALR